MSRPSEAALAAEYSQKADAYAQLWSPVIKPMAAPLLDALPLASARRILDAGSGTGAFLPDFRRAAPDAAVMAIDRADGMLRARSVPGFLHGSHLEPAVRAQVDDRSSDGESGELRRADAASRADAARRAAWV